MVMCISGELDSKQRKQPFGGSKPDDRLVARGVSEGKRHRVNQRGVGDSDLASFCCVQLSSFPNTNNFLKYILLIVLLQLSQFFSPLYPLHPELPFLKHPPPHQFMSMSHTYKFFGFSISYTILNLPLSILCLPIILVIPCMFFPHFPPSFPSDNPPCDL